MKRDRAPCLEARMSELQGASAERELTREKRASDFEKVYCNSCITLFSSSSFPFFFFFFFVFFFVFVFLRLDTLKVV